MARERHPRRIGRREAIALCGLLAGFASAAILTNAAEPPPPALHAPV